jgi:hypothetical protein
VDADEFQKYSRFSSSAKVSTGNTAVMELGMWLIKAVKFE